MHMKREHDGLLRQHSCKYTYQNPRSAAAEILQPSINHLFHAYCSIQNKVTRLLHHNRSVAVVGSNVVTIHDE